MTESEIIDKLLEFYATRETDYPVLTTGDMKLPHANAKNKMLAYKLIEKKPSLPNQEFYFLTELGYQAYEIGGFEIWKEENQKKADEIHRATIDSSKATVDAAKSARESKYAAWVATGAAVITFLYPLVNTVKENEKGVRIDTSIYTLNQKYDTLIRQFKARSHSRTIEGISSKTQKDTLVKRKIL